MKGAGSCFCILLSCFVINAVKINDRFSEELFIKPLPSGHVFAYFQFTTIWDVEYESNPYQNCHLFPRALGEIVTRYNVEELHISLTEGLWRHENWGYPVIDAPPGAEVWAWFKNGTSNIDGTWKELTSSLSGLLCASLNFIDTSNSMSPQFSFRPTGAVQNGQLDSSLLRYATLPQEIVCTENLTPWKKLLPCDSKRGLASLLNAGYIHNTNYHSLGIHLRNVCRDAGCSQLSIELRQTVSLVYDLVTVESGSADFSLRKLFGSGLHGPCPLADTSEIFIDVTSNVTVPFMLVPPPPEKTTSTRGGYTTHLAVYDVRRMRIDSMFNIAVSFRSKTFRNSKLPPVLTASRYISGYGQQKGGVVTKIHNRHWQPLHVVLLENIPWFVPIYLHTLRVTCTHVQLKPKAVRYIPGKARHHPAYLELVLELPPRAVTDVSVELDFVFLKWQEYPPDASHGFYIGSSVITSLLPLAKNYTGLPQDGSLFRSSVNASREGYLVQLRTESLIITLPTPDFSMPYNVICLACTVVALAFGPIHNITTKRLRLREVGSPQGVLSLVLAKVQSTLCGKKQEDQTNQSQEQEPGVDNAS